MTANQFADKLRACAPPVEKLRDQGVSAAGVEVIRKSYFCHFRGSASVQEREGPLFDLLEEYDLSGVDIGSVCFSNDVDRSGPKWRIGCFAEDWLVVEPQSGEIQVVDFSSNGHLLWECAENGSRLLDALLLAAAFLGRCSWDTQLFNDQSAHQRAATECTKAAGGERYRDFYLVICGCD
jgi:hypothetical protein